MSNWTVASEFCSPEDIFDNYNGKFVYEISICKLGAISLFFSNPQLPQPGLFAERIPPGPFTLGTPTMTCILVTAISLALTLGLRLAIWMAEVRRASHNREVALAQIDAPDDRIAFFTDDVPTIPLERIEADFSLEAQINVARSRRAASPRHAPEINIFFFSCVFARAAPLCSQIGQLHNTAQHVQLLQRHLSSITIGTNSRNAKLDSNC